MKTIFSFCTAITTPLLAATTKGSPSDPSAQTSNLLSSISLWEMLMKAGWVMVPLLLVSVIVVTLIFYYLVMLRRSSVATDGFRRSLETLIRERNFAAVVEACRLSPQALARVVGRAAQFKLDNPDADFSVVREVAEAEGNRQAAALNQLVVYLMDMGVLAPMLGLFGTVVGILRSFATIASSEATAMRTLLLAGGVSQALVATAAGLIVGITAMFFYSFFRGRAQNLISELETSATTLIAQMGSKSGA